jgi:uncharacterized protein
MKLTAEQRIAASRQRVWEALNDPEILRASIPGCQSLERESDTRFSAALEVKVGPIGARFKGTVSFADLNPPNGYTLVLEGNGGMAGSVKGRARVRLTEAGGGTLIAYDVDADVAGRLAQLGGPIIDATAKQLAGKFFSRFAEMVGAGEKPAQPPLVKGAAAKAAMPQALNAYLRAPSSGLPIAWVLASIVAALAGFLVGRSRGVVDSEWAGIAVAGAAFEYGRRSAAPVLMLDPALLRRLIEGAKE